MPSGTKSATRNPDLVKRWFSSESWNLGVVTGSKSGLIALDIDPRHNGDASLAALEAKHGPIPQTIKFLTGGGGQHILLRHPGGIVPNSASKIGKGIDVRGENGFIVAPPSQHISGRRYGISVDHHPDDIPLADAPPWLVGLIKSDAVGARSPQEWRGRIGSSIPEGRRNDSLARMAGHLLAHGIDPHVALDLMLSLNATHCRPSLPELEVLSIVASITNREIAKRLWGRWLVWDGTRWKIDETLMVTSLARNLVGEAQTEVLAGNGRQSLASSVASAKKVSAIENLARADRQHASEPSDWDRDLWVLNTPDGTVDLRTGQMRPHDRRD